MIKPSWLFWTISVLALLWGAFGVFDFYMTLTGNEKYLKDFPPEMIGWIQGFPAWRIFLWGLGVFTALAGPILMLRRMSAAVLVLWIGIAALLVGFVGHDLLMADGVKYYGQAGMIGSIIIVTISLAIALYASHAKKKGYLS